MCSESISILKQLLDGEIKTKSKFNNEDGGGSFNIAENLRLATEPQPRHRAHNDMKNKNNTKRTTSAKASGRKPVKREGKFNFIKEVLAQGKYTFAEIETATRAKFPKWSAKLVKCGIFSARMQMRKAKLAGDWMAAVEPAAQEPTAPPVTVPAPEPPPAPAAPAEAPLPEPQPSEPEPAPAEATEQQADAPATEAAA
jgi:hypothetical protein